MVGGFMYVWAFGLCQTLRNCGVGRGLIVKDMATHGKYIIFVSWSQGPMSVFHHGHVSVIYYLPHIHMIMKWDRSIALRHTSAINDHLHFFYWAAKKLLILVSSILTSSPPTNTEFGMTTGGCWWRLSAGLSGNSWIWSLRSLWLIWWRVQFG